MEEKAGGISPPSPIHIVLTPSEQAALQAILNAQRHPKVFNPWYNEATITFDHYPFNFTPIPSGTDLTFSQPYTLGYGVEITPSGEQAGIRGVGAGVLWPNRERGQPE
jgi:hypothetical protein